MYNDTGSTFRHGESRRFTMIEIIVLLVVLGLIVVIAAPRINKESKRMTVESALTSIRTAMSESALRARSTGTPIEIVLMPGDNQFIVNVSMLNLAKTWKPPGNDSLDQDGNPVPPFFIEAKPIYDLSKAIEWLPEDDNFDQDDNIVYTFFPDGQAAGRPLRFDVKGRNFILNVDKITGKPIILELHD